MNNTFGPPPNPAPIYRLVRPFEKFMEKETSGGILLIICLIIAMIWANFSGLFGWLFGDTAMAVQASYTTLWQSEFSVTGIDLKKETIHYWINDGLMAIFFFFVGLEIKAELVNGHLSSFKKASLPFIAAIGGMAVPAALYLWLNLGSSDGTGNPDGWGIPMATDIAFAIGILALLGSKVPVALKVFLVAVAIVDDLGAVLVIAIGYTDSKDINEIALLIGFAVLLVSALLNILGVRRVLPFVIVGFVVWIAFVYGGVHATVAGVLLAFTIPGRTEIDSGTFIVAQRQLVEEYIAASDVKTDRRYNAAQLAIMDEMERNVERRQMPMERFKNALLPWVSFFIMPVFALANAGVTIKENFVEILIDNVSVGIILGLFVGKVVGVTIFAYAAVKLRIAEMPQGSNWLQIIGVGFLAGIGFTMSLFIAALAFPGEDMTLTLEHAKVGILMGSLLSGVSGYLLLYFVGKRKQRKEAELEAKKAEQRTEVASS